MGHRIAQINELIKKTLGPIINDVLGKRNFIVTITDTDCNSDLKQVRVWISVLGNKKEGFNYLDKNLFLIQKSFNTQIKLKKTPQIVIKEDKSVEKVQRLSKYFN